MKKDELKSYSPEEERINTVSHFCGIIFSVIALLLLTLHTCSSGDLRMITSSIIFGISLILVYTASTLYHSSKKPEIRKRFKIFDHAAIYILIAGTYTPFMLITLNGITIGRVLLITTWSIAVAGVIMKLFLTGRFKLLSTILYLLMGWIIMFAIKPLSENLPLPGLLWLIAGGLSYTIGAIIYGIKKIKMNHAIFHFFVLGGSISHFISIYFYVLA